MEFNKLTLECIRTLKPFFENNRCRICDCTIGGTFMWRDYHDTQYAVEDGTLFLKVVYPEYGPSFAPPRGEGAGERKVYERIIEFCSENNMPARICAVSEAVKKHIQKMFPDAVIYTDRAWSDYLYLSGDIKELSGRKYAGQRNHINRFTREHLTWSFEHLTGNNISEACAFFKKNSLENVKDSAAYDEGNRKTIEVLENFELYDQLGGVLRVDGSIVGASLGEIVGDTLFVHVEKADTAYHGSYPMLVNQFAKMFAVGEIEYINREEDDGVEGLRTSKLSYHPTAILDKYIIEIR